SLSRLVLGQVANPRRRRSVAPVHRGWDAWLGEPRNVVLLVLGAVLVIGGGRRLFQAWRARAGVGRLDEGDVTTDAIEAAAEHGRAGLMGLFHLLGSARSEAQRQSAGYALSVLWARDELIAEEEKALVRRGFDVRWRARMRYPR